MFLRSKILKLRSPVTQQAIRTFLSENYNCTNEWNSRLSPSFMESIKMERFYYDIQQAGKNRAIDVDMYMNKVTPNAEIHVDEITDLLQKTRLTEEASNVLESTGHAVIRNLIDTDHIAELLHILENRMTYGVFLDNYIASYVLNSLVLKEDFHTAARVAGLLMLEEDFSDPLVRAFSLHSAFKYLEKCEPFHEPPPEAPPVKGKVQEVKVRVKFLRNEFFDDHFDLTDNKHIVGKTFVLLSKFLDPVLSVNSKILGYTLHQKNEKALELLKSTKSDVFYKDVIDYCVKFSEEGSDLRAQFESLKNSRTEKFEEVTKSLIQKAVQENEGKTIEEQKKVYQSWNVLREEKYKEALDVVDKKKRVDEIEKLQKEMHLEEQKLWFFENEDKIDLEIDAKKVTYPKRWFGKLKKPRVVDEGYIPPEIVKQRRRAL
ncbi:MRPS27 family protein [Megaselia abdita]